MLCMPNELGGNKVIQEEKEVYREVALQTQRLTRTVYHIGIALCLQFIVTMLIFVIGIVGGLVLRQGEYKGIVSILEVANDPLIMSIILIFIGIVANILPFIRCAQKIHLPISEFTKYSHVPLSKYALYLIACVGMNYLGGLIVSILSEGMHLMNVEPNYLGDMKMYQWIGNFLNLMYIILIAPMTEEFVCRGVILHGLRQYGDKFALIASSIMFGLLHGNIKQCIPATLIGLVLGFISLRRGSIRPAIIIHMINNLIVVVLNQLYSCVDGAKLIVDTILGVCMIISAICILLIHNKDYRELGGKPEVCPHYMQGIISAWPLVLIELVYIVMIICRI